MTEQDETIKIVKRSTKRVKKQQISLQKYYNDDINVLEIGIDEAGRGPMFGRVYSGAVILPKDDSFDHSLMKDSKRFHSKKKNSRSCRIYKEKRHFVVCRIF